MQNHPIVVIGIGPGAGGLFEAAHDYIASAQLLAGGKRHLSYFPDWQGERLEIDADLPRVIARLKERSPDCRCVVLASGDPLFFGIGKTLLEHFGPDELLFLPSVSSVQLAFARLKMPWDDARVVSLHGRPIENLRFALADGCRKIALLTDATNDPAAIARYLKDQGFSDDYAMWVGEALASPQERCAWLAAGEVPQAALSPLNVVVLVRRDLQGSDVRSPPAAVFNGPACTGQAILGLHEALFQHRGGQITRWEVRLIALGQLTLEPGNVLWDVGAGSGSLGIEAARLCPTLSVWAIEKESEACRQIAENSEQFRVANVSVVCGEAPTAFANLPRPDAVFVGGSGGHLAGILEAAANRLVPGGRLVLNCVTLDTLTLAWNWFREHGWSPEVTSVQLARSRPLGKLNALEPERPIFIVRVQKS